MTAEKINKCRSQTRISDLGKVEWSGLTLGFINMNLIRGDQGPKEREFWWL